jgi:hypothetical protein
MMHTWILRSMATATYCLHYKSAALSGDCDIMRIYTYDGDDSTLYYTYLALSALEKDQF